MTSPLTSVLTATTAPPVVAVAATAVPETVSKAVVVTKVSREAMPPVEPPVS